MNIDREDILVLTKEVKQCSNCHCDCHCNTELHTPSDELDTGGPCVCDECYHTNNKKLDEDSFNGA